MSNNESENSEIELRIPPNREYLSLIRDIIHKMTQNSNVISENCMSNLELCVSETLANSIKALDDMESNEAIIVRLAISSDRVTAEVEDKGGGFDPKLIPVCKSTGELLNSGSGFLEKGRGLALVKDATDECEINTSKEGTKIIMSIYTGTRFQP